MLVAEFVKACAEQKLGGLHSAREHLYLRVKLLEVNMKANWTNKSNKE